MNYPSQEPQPNPEYQGGYQQQPMPSQYPPQTPQPYAMPQQQPVRPGYPQPAYYPPQAQPMAYPQQQQMYAPYPPQQMMMPPQMQSNVVVNIGNQQKRQLPMIIRIIYFLCIGMYLGMFWIGVALFLCCTVIGLPLGLMMFNQLPAVLTLKM